MREGGVVEVRLWGTTVGSLGYAPDQTEIATFEYDEKFMEMGIQISPAKMSYHPAKHTFDDISKRTFHGLAGIFADSLPDKFGNQLIDQFMADRGIPQDEVTALDRLLYVGDRGMGALEYHPVEESKSSGNVALDLHTLSELSSLVLKKREEFQEKLHCKKSRRDALNIIRVGSSAGGARAKALVAIDKAGKFYDGTEDWGTEFGYWMIKFDTDANSDREGKDPKGMTKIEYIYSKIAKSCGINIPQTNYVEEEGNFHFLIERFDRVVDEENKKLKKAYYASWAGLSHADRDSTGAYSYEQLVLLGRELGLGQDEITEIYRRAIFNVVGRNQDDHTKNFGFMMDRNGKWSLSPAFDMTYAYDPSGKWTRVHQIKLGGKQDEFTIEDLLSFGKYCNLSNKKAKEIIEKTVDAFGYFNSLAQEFHVEKGLKNIVKSNQRLSF